MALKRTILMAALAATLALVGCGKPAPNSTSGGSTTGDQTQTGNVSGAVAVDGSSTVGPILSAIAEEFGKENPDVRPTVGISGTGGGFKKLAAGEIDIADAS